MKVTQEITTVLKSTTAANFRSLVDFYRNELKTKEINLNLMERFGI